MLPLLKRLNQEIGTIFRKKQATPHAVVVLFPLKNRHRLSYDFKMLQRHLYSFFFLIFLSACSAAPFPDPPGADGLRDVPFSTTYLFQFKTGSRDITDPDPNRLLRIITLADILTLKNAASTSQLNKNGLIGGSVQGPQGPVREVALEITDIDGNLVGKISGGDRNLFYNSLGRVPDLLIDQGSGDEGTFTLFNAPPGELFFQAIRGGRGNTRISSFAANVSLGRMDVLPILPEKIGILGVIVDAGGATGGISGATASFFGRREPGVGNAAGLFILSADQGLPTQGEFLIRLSAPDFRDTIHRFDTAKEKIEQRQQAFDPLTADRLLLFLETNLQNMATRAGITLGPSWGIIHGRVGIGGGTGQKDAVVTPLDRDGNRLPDPFYFNALGELNPDLKATTDNSQFILFLQNCPAGPQGEVFLHVNARSVDPDNQRPIFSAGRAVAFCQPGTVFAQEIINLALPTNTETEPPPTPLPTPAPDLKPRLTVLVEGQVTSEKGDRSIPGAQIKLIGSSGGATTGENGTYRIEKGNFGDLSPLLANSDYTVKTFKDAGFIPTYQTISTGPTGGKRDLILLDVSAKNDCPSGDLRIFGNIRDIGFNDLLREGRGAEGIALKVLRESGEEVGRTVYPGSLAGSTAGNGRFLVCDLGPGLYQLQVTTPEDSGTALVQVYDDGVTLFSMKVNKALRREVTLTGQVQNLSGPEAGAIHPVGNMNIAILGTQRRLATDPSGHFGASLESNSRFIARVEKEGYLPSYNYQIETPIRIPNSTLPPLWTVSKEALLTLAGQAGVDTLPENGVIAGKVIARGFAQTGSTFASSASAPIGFFPGFLDEDGHIDLLTISNSGEIDLRLGNGAGGFSQKTPSCPPLSVPPQIVEPFDINRDGRLDLVLLANNNFFIFMGNGQGCFTAGPEVTLPRDAGTPRTFSITDLNGDGFQDILIATDKITPLVRLANKTDGSFEPFKMGGECGNNPVAVRARQSGSGLIDILIADTQRGICDITYNPNEEARPTKFLTFPSSLPLPSDIKTAKIGFLNLDATPDLLVLHEKGGAVFLETPPTGETASLLTSFILPDGFGPKMMTIADVNRDGRFDLVVGGTGGTLFLLGNGNGTFGSPIPVATPTTTGFALADFNEDGKEDLALSLGLEMKLFPGTDRAVAGARIEARDREGHVIGKISYFDGNGVIRPEGTATTESGRFLIFNVPPGFTNISATEGGAGNAMVTTYTGSLSYLHLNINPVAPPDILLDGVVINPTGSEFAGIDVRGIHVVPLGTGKEVVSGEGGAYQLRLGANSEYVIKLDP